MKDIAKELAAANRGIETPELGRSERTADICSSPNVIRHILQSRRSREGILRQQKA